MFIPFLYQAANPPALGVDPQAVDDFCAMTGHRITFGYPVENVISPATAEVSDTFPYPSDFVSVEAAELFRAQMLVRGNLLFLENKLLQPMVRLKSAREQDRDCWRDLIFSLQIGTPCVTIITDESKRRLWHKAKLSVFGEYWQPFFNGSVVRTGKTFKTPPMCRSLSIKVFELRDCLKRVEMIQAQGFSKRGIYEGILQESNTVDKVGLREALENEKVLSKWRGTDAFGLALFLAQGGKEKSDKNSH